MPSLFQHSYQLLRERAEAVRDDARDRARPIADLARDIGGYALHRARERYYGVPPDFDPIVRCLNDLHLQAEAVMTEAKKQTALAIADEKRLALKAREDPTRYMSDWQEQKAHVAELKQALRAHNARLQHAKLERDRIVAQRRIARLNAALRHEKKRTEDLQRLLDRLAEPEPPVS